MVTTNRQTRMDEVLGVVSRIILLASGLKSRDGKKRDEQLQRGVPLSQNLLKP